MLYCVMTLAALLSMAGCRVEGTWLQKYSETVMTPGMRIEATNANGTVVITAGTGTRRTFEGDGWSRSAQLIGRTERWNGSLGLYHGGIGGHGQVVQAEEGRIHVNSVDEALRWLYPGSAITKPVYTNNGLVFLYDVAEPVDPETQVPVRSVEIFQIYINGKRPTSMPGADDDAIKVSGGEVLEESHPFPAPVGDEIFFAQKKYAPATRPATTQASD